MKPRYELLQISYFGGEEVVGTFNTKQEAEAAKEVEWNKHSIEDFYTVFHIRKIKRSI